MPSGKAGGMSGGERSGGEGQCKAHLAAHGEAKRSDAPSADCRQSGGAMQSSPALPHAQHRSGPHPVI